MTALESLNGLDPGRIETLKRAFEVFNQLSEALTVSYRELESQVARLTEELAAARSERLKALVEKEKLATKLARLLEVLPGGVIVLDGAGRIAERNPKAAELLGEPLLGEPWDEVSRRCFVPEGVDPHERRLKDGRTVSILTRPLSGETGQILLLTDVTERRALQELLEHQRRLAAMGEMVAGLAHQVRTPLASALLYATQLENLALDEERRRRFTAKLVERLQHLESQVDAMLGLSRKGRFALEPIPVADFLRRLAEAVEPRLAGTAVRLRVVDLTGGAAFEGNWAALEGGFLNLLGNALEALAGRGQIELRAAQEGAWLCLSVIDDGPGMEEAVRARIFEPFFTTRPQGTGLGLPLVASIVKAHGGTVRCESVPGQGTAVHVYLPSAVGRVPLPATARQLKEASR
ncbi:sensor histidine kinase FleS [Methylothermus subterraneus]